MLEDYKKLSSKYLDIIQYYNYPGKVFYLSSSFYWITEQFADYYGVAMPFVFGITKKGDANWELPMRLGPAEVVIKKIEEKKETYLKENKNKTDKITKEFLEWLKKKKIKQGMKLDYYLKELHDANDEIIKTNIHFQISAHIEVLLQEKLEKSGLTKEEYSILAVSEHKPAFILHEEEQKRFLELCKKHSIKDYKEIIENPELKKALEKCYEKGYFLNASYGGVKFWTLKDEYNDSLKEKTKRKKELPKKIKLTKEQQANTSQN
jgi:hypothetical protein